MSARKRHNHKCFNHLKIQAKARCSKCGKWICGECTVLYQGKFFCAQTCVPPQTEVPTRPETAPLIETENEPLESASVSAQQASNFWRSMVLWSAVTLSLCSMIFGIWSIWEITNLRKENAFLRESRFSLVSDLKINNLEINYLRKQLISYSKSPQSQETSRLPKELPTLKPSTSMQPLPDFRNEPAHPVKYIDGIPLTFNNGAIDKPLVSITFDGGSFANAVPDILDTLGSRNVKATMFLTGEFIRKYPDVVAKIISQGHEIGNHTEGHKHFTTFAQDKTQTTLQYVNHEFIARELKSAEKLLFEKTGASFVPLWRAPYGEFNETICKWAVSCGYIHVGWRQGRTWKQSLDSNDWVPDEETPGYKSPHEVLDKILAAAETKPDGINGGIILMHLGTARFDKSKQVHLILGTLIDSLRTLGYRIVPVTEMIRQSGVDITNLTNQKTVTETKPEAVGTRHTAGLDSVPAGL